MNPRTWTGSQLKRAMKAGTLFFHNPLLLFQLLNAKMNTAIHPRPRGRVQKQINGVYFEFDFDYGPQMKTMYFGAYEILNVDMMKRLLREGETFIDVGANIGYLSAIAAGWVGPRGQVHSFEPAPRDFLRLKKLSLMNPAYKIIANHCAVGEKIETATIDITSLSWMGWNTMVPGFMRRDAWKENLEVPVLRLDEYIEERKKEMGRISLIKIDTEGFELPILKGLQGYFENHPDDTAILCEINPRAYPLLGRTLTELSNYMKTYHYRSYSLLNPRVEVDITQLEATTDVLYRKN